MASAEQSMRVCWATALNPTRAFWHHSVRAWCMPRWVHWGPAPWNAALCTCGNRSQPRLPTCRSRPSVHVVPAPTPPRYSAVAR